MPPRLSATALFWWGVGLIVAGVLGTVAQPYLFSALGYATGISFVQSVVGLVSAFLSIAHVLGAGLVAAAFTVRALSRDTNDRYTGPAPYSPAKPGNQPPR